MSHGLKEDVVIKSMGNAIESLQAESEAAELEARAAKNESLAARSDANAKAKTVLARTILQAKASFRGIEVEAELNAAEAAYQEASEDATSARAKAEAIRAAVNGKELSEEEKARELEALVVASNEAERLRGVAFDRKEVLKSCQRREEEVRKSEIEEIIAAVQKQCKLAAKESERADNVASSLDATEEDKTIAKQKRQAAAAAEAEARDTATLADTYDVRGAAQSRMKLLEELQKTALEKSERSS
jgi:hypothetical protein